MRMEKKEDAFIPKETEQKLVPQTVCYTTMLLECKDSLDFSPSLSRFALVEGRVRRRGGGLFRRCFFFLPENNFRKSFAKKGTIAVPPASAFHLFI